MATSEKLAREYMQGRKTHDSAVTSKGQVTLPKEYRDAQGIKEGEDVVVFRENDDGTLTVIPPKTN